MGVLNLQGCKNVEFLNNRFIYGSIQLVLIPAINFLILQTIDTRIVLASTIVTILIPVIMAGESSEPAIITGIKIVMKRAVKMMKINVIVIYKIF